MPNEEGHLTHDYQIAGCYLIFEGLEYICNGGITVVVEELNLPNYLVREVEGSE